jgi:hypothetical protein
MQMNRFPEVVPAGAWKEDLGSVASCDGHEAKGAAGAGISIEPSQLRGTDNYVVTLNSCQRSPQIGLVGSLTARGTSVDGAGSPAAMRERWLKGLHWMSP